MLPTGGRGRCVRVQGHHTGRWSATRRAGADRFARRARWSVAVTTDEVCGGTSLRVLARSGRRCRGATTRPNRKSIGCAGSASTSVRLGRAANATSKTILQSVVSSPGSAQEYLSAPGPGDLPSTRTRNSACREVTDGISHQTRGASPLLNETFLVESRAIWGGLGPTRPRAVLPTASTSPGTRWRGSTRRAILTSSPKRHTRHYRRPLAVSSASINSWSAAARMSRSDVNRVASLPARRAARSDRATRKWSSCGFLGCLDGFENRTITTITPTMVTDFYTT